LCRSLAGILNHADMQSLVPDLDIESAAGKQFAVSLSQPGNHWLPD